MPSLKALFLSGLLLSASGLSQAALFNVDYQTSGDNLILADTAQNLQWLKWTVTTPYSYNTIKQLTAPGQQFAGWRLATQSEYLTLLSDAGVPNIGGRTVANIPSVTSLLPKIGVNNFFSFLGAGNSTAAFIESGNNVSTALFATLTIETFDNPITAKAGDFGSGVTGTAFGLGSALVRTAPVPIPAAVWLFGSALAGLGLFRRRQVS